jgi:hypothetical protein
LKGAFLNDCSSGEILIGFLPARESQGGPMADTAEKKQSRKNEETH